MKVCKLCNQREATKTNSHISPRFFGVSMLLNKDGTRTSYEISSSSGINRRPQQDTPKEDYVLCPQCESLIDKNYESPFARDFYRVREDPRYYFTVFVRNHHIYRVYHKIDYELFHKFFYSIIVRVCISDNVAFRRFKLPFDQFEKLRKIVVDEIPYEDFPMYILTCPNNPHPTGNFIGALSYHGGLHYISVNEYIIVIDLSDDKLIENQLKNFKNTSLQYVRLLTLPYNYWESWRIDMAFKPIFDIMYINKMIEHLMNGIIIAKLEKEGIIKKVIQ